MTTGAFLPVSRTTLLMLLGGTACLVLAHSLPLTGWAYADWAAASAEARQGVTLAGVWAAGCAAWAASQHSTPTSVTCPIPAVRNGVPFVRGQAVLLIGAAVAGEAVGLAPAYLWCAIHADYASDVRPLVIAAGFAVLVAAVCFGYLCGALLPRLLATPAAVVLTFAAVALTNPSGSPLAPVWPFEVAAGLSEPASVAVLRLGFFITTSALCLATSVRWLECRRPEPGTVLQMATLVAPIPLIVLLTISNPLPVLHRDVEARPRCAPVATSQVCVHPARTDLLPDLTDLVRTMATVVGPEFPPPVTIYDATTRLPGSPDGLALQLQYEDPDRWRALAALDLATAFTGNADCPTDITGSGSSPGDVSSAAAVWLASQVDARAAVIAATGPASELTSRLLREPPTAVTSNLRRSLRELRSCQATIDDLLPR